MKCMFLYGGLTLISPSIRCKRQFMQENEKSQLFSGTAGLISNHSIQHFKVYADVRCGLVRIMLHDYNDALVTLSRLQN